MWSFWNIIYQKKTPHYLFHSFIRKGYFTWMKEVETNMRWDEEVSGFSLDGFIHSRVGACVLEKLWRTNNDTKEIQRHRKKQEGNPVNTEYSINPHLLTIWLYTPIQKRETKQKTALTRHEGQPGQYLLQFLRHQATIPWVKYSDVLGRICSE